MCRPEEIFPKDFHVFGSNQSCRLDPRESVWQREEIKGTQRVRSGDCPVVAKVSNATPVRKSF